MNDKKSRYQRPEGALLEQAMKGPPRVSNRHLAEQAGLSEGRIRQIVNGYRTEAGQVLEIVAPTDTLVRLAETLSISAEDMRDAGRPDVADLLITKPRVGITETGELWLSDNSEEVDALREWLEAGDDNTPPPSVSLGLWDFEQLMQAAMTKHADEIRLLNFVVNARGAAASDDDEGDAGSGRHAMALVASDDFHLAAMTELQPGELDRQADEQDADATAPDPPGPEGGA